MNCGRGASVGSSPLTRGKLLCVATLAGCVGLIPAHAGKIGDSRVPAPARRAHPRSRGENLLDPIRINAREGSSPLTRGKSSPRRRPVSPTGLIPAHAGKIQPWSGRGLRMGAHPRSRGENSYAATIVAMFMGSSPLTRGKLCRSWSMPWWRRLIPAHAGKIVTQVVRLVILRAHPRSRGENAIASAIATFVAGSSPLTRGKWGTCAQASPPSGLIPAHAGKMTARRPSPPQRPAHPRSRGENPRPAIRTATKPGSSPLTRGKFPAHNTGVFKRGLIPAHAGKIRARPGLRPAWRAHPRSRGENCSRAYSHGSGRGSSPLTRGKFQHRRVGHHGGGLIPAHAGKIRVVVGVAASAAAHPRSRGENVVQTVDGEGNLGSSPLTRGKSQARREGQRGHGLIPAHAGKIVLGVG